METMLTDLPDWIKGDWCNVQLAEQTDDTVDAKTVEEADKQSLKSQWARYLLTGHLRAAHKSWGKWQGFTGGDPWEDDGWRNFLELQRFGESLWEDFDASRFEEYAWFRTYISYWESAT